MIQIDFIGTARAISAHFSDPYKRAWGLSLLAVFHRHEMNEGELAYIANEIQRQGMSFELSTEDQLYKIIRANLEFAEKLKGQYTLSGDLQLFAWYQFVVQQVWSSKKGNGYTLGIYLDYVRMKHHEKIGGLGIYPLNESGKVDTDALKEWTNLDSHEAWREVAFFPNPKKKIVTFETPVDLDAPYRAKVWQNHLYTDDMTHDIVAFIPSLFKELIRNLTFKAERETSFTNKMELP